MGGAFKGRNLYYLRLKGTVLPLYVFLDEKHVKWMDDITLQRVLSDLRPHIVSELMSATNAGKTKINTIRGDEYQFCYFFRNADHHSVLLKRRFYTTDPSTTGNNKGKRKSRSKDAVSTEAPRKSKRKRRERQDMEVDQEVVSAEEVTDAAAGGNEEPGSSSARGLSEGPDTPSLPVDDAMDLEPEEEKPKPRLRLTYEGLRLNSQCLCVVVEPVQKKGNAERGPPSVAANEPERQPLFLSEEDYSEEEDQPSGVAGDMMTFSQRLHAMVDYTTGAADDGEDTQGDVFLGDADDAREF